MDTASHAIKNSQIFLRKYQVPIAYKIFMSLEAKTTTSNIAAFTENGADVLRYLIQGLVLLV